MDCRHCQNPLSNVFLDLGHAPPSNAYLCASDLHQPEEYFPLRLYVCERCWLVQTEDCTPAENLFAADYAYFSSASQSWLEHASHYVEDIIRRLGLNHQSHVVEIASNDGYLLRFFLDRGIPCLGIEPTASTAEAAEATGIPVLREFFGAQLAQQLLAEGRQADLLIGNNVYAHVPDINDFTTGLKTALKPNGTITLEFPHLLKFLQNKYWDTAYHEHFSYLSLQTVQQIFARAGLRVFDVEELATHGGSLRVFGCHQLDPRPETALVGTVLANEEAGGLNRLETYLSFQQDVDSIKDGLLEYLIQQKREHKVVAGYGAAAKGNTLLNYAGVKPDLLPFICDAATSKQGKFMPGSHIPILDPAAMLETMPDTIVILPWNIADEIVDQIREAKAWPTTFVTAIPEIIEIEPPV